ncbi:hypothetical protein AB4252_06840 [Vibrio cyclitrophicus]
MAPISIWRQYQFGAIHQLATSNLTQYKSSTATKPTEKQKDQSQALLLEASQEGLHLLALCYNIP